METNMVISCRSLLALVVVGAAIFQASVPAQAQSFPDKPLLLVVGYAPGSAPGTKTELSEASFSTLGTNHAHTKDMLRAETERWASVVKSSKFSGD
jgi:uncharacterized protein YggE